MPERALVIAIDGPSGVGKSTVAKALAQRLDLRYLDTGAMYRALALQAIRKGLQNSKPTELGRLAESLRVSFEGPASDQRVLLDGEDVTDSIRAQEVGELASALSVHPEVRREMVAAQRRIIGAGGWTLEGRDTTTVVFPDADVKVYLDATPEARARRRYEELLMRGLTPDLQTVLEQQRIRDQRDLTRADSPLRCAEDALRIDTTYLTVEEVVNLITERIGR